MYNESKGDLNEFEKKSGGSKKLSDYTALWHIFRRFNDTISIDFLVECLQRGLLDTDKHVASVVVCIIEDVEFKMPESKN